MRIAHCVGWYAPDSIGGSEVYVDSLARALRAFGVESVVLAPRDGQEPDRYLHQGIEVLRYPIPRERERDQHEGRRPHDAFDVFQSLLREARADVFHLHSLTYGANRHHLEHARSTGMATVSTIHVPGPLCERGTLMRFGREACDGLIDARQCVPCWLEAKRVPAPLARPLGALVRRLPASAAARAPGRLYTLLSAPARIARRKENLLRLAEQSQRLIAVSGWLHAALRRNGVAPEKLILCRQGVAPPHPACWGPLPNDLPGRPLRVGFFGRADPVKGLELLVQAVRSMPPALGIRLSLYAIAQDAASRDHLASSTHGLGADARIQLRATLPADGVRDAMRAHDVIAVPSQWLETGPLVAMEALAVGIPVLGSDLGGLRELVTPGRHGWLLPARDVQRWRDELARLCRERPLLSWAPAETPIVTHEEVARRHAELYRELA